MVLDSMTERPLPGVRVMVQGAVAGFTDELGQFILRDVPLGTRVFRFEALGYAPLEVEADPPVDELWRVRLSRDPIEIPGLRAERRRFEARLDSVSELMDSELYGGTYWVTPPKVARLDRLREQDDIEDHAFRLAAALRLMPVLDGECGLRYFGGVIQPRFYLDGEDMGWNGCYRFADLDPTHLCRIEMVGGNVRLYTCAFMARLASGEASVPRMMEILIPEWWNPIRQP